MSTRREALIAGAAWLVAACGGPAGDKRSAASGSTLLATWVDPGGTGILQRGPGEPLIARTELGPRAAGARVLATLAHVTDAHVLDASSPARVPFLDRLGEPFQSTFRPQETLTGHVLAGALAAVRSLRPDAVIQGGDLIDNAQANELSSALAALRGGRVNLGRYYGVQLPSNPDPFYYRPDLDAPRHPRLLRAGARPFTSPGLGSRWYPVLGDHDILVQGEIAPTPETRSLAVGDQALWELPRGLTVPPGVSATLSPDGPPDPKLISGFLAQALAGPKVRVPADPARRQMRATEVVGQLAGAGSTLDYHADVGSRVRLIVLDVARRAGGSGGLVRSEQPAWLASELRQAGDRWVIVISHQPLAGSEGGEELLALLDRHPRVIAALAGHTHRNEIVPRASGYWLITTASLIDFPQQTRALRVLETAGGGVAIQTWMLDHVGALAEISRELAYLDAHGGRPKRFAGTRLDRNVTLYRRPV